MEKRESFTATPYKQEYSVHNITVLLFKGRDTMDEKPEAYTLNREDSTDPRSSSQLLRGTRPLEAESEYTATSTPAEKEATNLIKVSCYISLDDDRKLEQILLKRRYMGEKTDKSALIREAIHLLQE